MAGYWRDRAGWAKPGLPSAQRVLWSIPEGRNRHLIERRSHPDIIRLQRLAKEPPKEGEEPDPDAELKRSISVDQIRELQHA